MSENKEFPRIDTVSHEHARWLALHGYATVVGHGEIVDTAGKVIKVSLVEKKRKR